MPLSGSCASTGPSAVSRPARPPLTRLAQELGYFDQAHFIHDFKAGLRGVARQYRAGMSAFYKEPLKL